MCIPLLYDSVCLLKFVSLSNDSMDSLIVESKIICFLVTCSCGQFQEMQRKGSDALSHMISVQIMHMLAQKEGLIRYSIFQCAVCLDGTLPAYHIHRGYGSGANSWLVQLEGGGWCDTIRNCVYRKKTRRGSSAYMEKQIPFSGILSNKAGENPGYISGCVLYFITHKALLFLHFLSEVISNLTFWMQNKQLQTFTTGTELRFDIVMVHLSAVTVKMRLPDCIFEGNVSGKLLWKT